MPSEQNTASLVIAKTKTLNPQTIGGRGKNQYTSSWPQKMILETAEMHSLYRQGASLVAVGQAFGKDGASVLRRFNRLGYATRPLKPEVLTREQLIEKFMRLVSPEPNTGCWLWTGYVCPEGYGQFGRCQRAHILSYRLFAGEIPAGLELDHLCRVRSCVNFLHLEPVTGKENVRRGMAAQTVVRVNSLKTKCPQGHPYSGENLLLKKNGGGRRCAECGRQETKRSRAKKRTQGVLNARTT